MNDVVDLLFDWQDEAEARRREAAEAPVERGTKGSGPAPLPWPPREVTEEELASGSTRTCKTCRGTYPETPEFYVIRQSGPRKGYAGTECRECQNQRTRHFTAQKTLPFRCRRIHGEAKRRGIEWAFDSPEVLREFYGAPCHYCGGEVEHRLGLDRVDNDKGYVPGNVVQCCARCNWMKRELAVDEWLAHMRRVLDHTSQSGSGCE